MRPRAFSDLSDDKMDTIPQHARTAKDKATGIYVWYEWMGDMGVRVTWYYDREG